MPDGASAAAAGSFATGVIRPPRPGHIFPPAAGARQQPGHGATSDDERRQARAPAKVVRAEAAAPSSGEEEAHRAVRALRRVVHDGLTARLLKQYEQGRKHRNKAAHLAGEMNVRCLVCEVHLSFGLNVEQHLAGKQHAWRLMLNGGGA